MKSRGRKEVDQVAQERKNQQLRSQGRKTEKRNPEAEDVVATQRITITLSEPAVEEIKQLRPWLHVRSRGDVIEQLIWFGSWMREMLDQGAQIVVMSPDGTPEQMLGRRMPPGMAASLGRKEGQ